MGYAIRKDGNGWRAVDSVNDCADDEEFSENQPGIIQPEPTYAQLRAAEYPPFQDYLDGIVKSDDKQVKTYIDSCKAVKLKYPKDQKS